jgi:hypothetical protein
MKPVYQFTRALLTLAVLAPWLWLALFTAFAVAATVHLGRLPSYNNPDPKDIAHLAWLHGATSRLLILMALSPLVVCACLGLRAFISPDIGNERWRLLAYGLGYALAALVLRGNLLGLGTCFLD